MTGTHRLIPSFVPALVAALSLVTAATAQVPGDEQAACMNGLNKSGAKLASTQGKADVTCVKNTGKGTEADATACLTRDDGGKVAKAAGKVTSTESKSCSIAPDFGPTSASTVSDAARNETAGLATDLFGSDPTSTLFVSSSNADGAKCQASAMANVQKLANQIVKDFNACKSSGLKAGTLDSSLALAACLDVVDADAKGKVASASGKVMDTVTGTCATTAAAALPGACSGYSDLEACIVALARCRACSTLALMDDLGNVCDGFDDGQPGNLSCGTPAVVGEHFSIPNSVEPAHTPGSPGVVVTNPKLLTQFPPAGPNLNRSDYIRFHLTTSYVEPDLILVLVPGFGAGVNIFRIMAEDLLPKMLREQGLVAEIWAFSRRDDQLEDRAGAVIAADAKDPLIAMDWYYGSELGLSLSPELAAGPARRAVFYNSSSDIPFLADFTPQVFSRDLDVVIDEALAHTSNVFLGGHSAGTGFAARYAATDFNLSGVGPAVPGYAKLRGLVLFEGGGGSTAASAPLSADTIDRIVAKADGGLFGAVRDNAPRCVNGTTPCTIATEATDCFGQTPPKCTLPTTSYASLGGLQPQVYAAGEVGAVQGMKDPDSGQAILQVDQGSAGNNAIAKVPGLSILASVVPATVEGLFGTFLDDDEIGALISPALATSLGYHGPVKNGLLTWIDIDGDGQIPSSAKPSNGAQPTTLPASNWGMEVEVTRMDRHRSGFIAGGENSSDWYYAGSGLGVLGVTGVCSSGSCTVGKSGSCATNSDCSQSISLDSSALSATRPDIANLTQAGNIDIPVIAFGGSNGLTPVGASYLGFAQSIAACTRPGCDGTPRVVSASVPSAAFPTYGDAAGGFEVYISTGYAHVDVVTAEDTADNQIPERLASFLERNLLP